MLRSLHRILVAALLVISWPAMAEDDPPARVGRLAHLENEVNFRADRSDQGGPATLNWPISSGAILETGRRGRAEVWIGSTAYRVGDDSQIEFPVVDDARVDVRLNEGTLAISILDRDQVDDVVVATPDGDVRFLTPGRYRIDVLADRSELSVQAGRATFADGQRVTPVAAGQKASRWSDGRERLDADRNQDAFDQWVASRENATLAGPARRYVSPHMTGYQDLDAYGDWQTAPDYGAVWYPRGVADDWAPYRYGRWAWVAPWGWTWIDLAPWGFAPFHYGRWVIIYGRWAWVPGRLVARPVYAPALVAWIGNPGWNVSFSFGAAPAVGWFPLAPRDVYVPWHRHSHRYVRQINITHIHNVTVIDRALRSGRHTPFEYRNLPRAVTVVPTNLVREGRSISARDVRRPERSELGRAPLVRQAPAADWLAPAPGARRSHDGEARSVERRQPRRDFDVTRPEGRERRLPGADTTPRDAERPASRVLSPEGVNGRETDLRRDGPRRPAEVRPAVPESAPGRAAERRNDVFRPSEPSGRQSDEAAPLLQRRGERQRPADESPERGLRREAPVPELRTAMPESAPDRPAERRNDVFRPSEPSGRQPDEAAPPPRRGERQRPADESPERGPRREALAPELRPAVPESAPGRPLERRGDVFRPSEPSGRQFDEAPPSRREERPRPLPQSSERESRPEPARDFQRMERQAPPQIMRQPEPRPPAPAVRAPEPQREMRQPRMEAPRQPAPQGGGQGEQRRRHDDERGGR